MKTADFESAESVPAVYIHIPFCKKVCSFCSFAVMKDNPAQHKTYLELLQKEFYLVSKDKVMDFSLLESIYIGGGTPSRLSLSLLQQLRDWIINQCDPKRKIEWAIEVNPEDVTAEFVDGLVDLGFSRVSIGVQSFNETQLNHLSRQHTANQSRQSIETLISRGINNLNIDLMFGYPGQTVLSLEADLHAVQQYNTKHVSVYSLTIEPKTALNRKPIWKNWIKNNEALIADMYQIIVDKLAVSGIEQYEVSNFCRPGFESRQNMIYWQSRNYLGLGTGAHSHCFSSRWGNYIRLVDYKRLLNKGVQPFVSMENINAVNKRDEEIMLRLRLKKGIDIGKFCQKHNLEFSAKWNSLVEGFRENSLIENCSSHIKLTTKGMLLADEISALLAASLP